jgi:serine/threonine protein phosphatase PrpC
MVSGQLDSIEAYTISIFDGHGGDQLSKYAS